MNMCDKKKFFLIFFIFGFVILFLTLSINLFIYDKQIKDEFLSKAKYTIDIKEELFKNYISKLKWQVISISNSDCLNEFIKEQNKINKNRVEQFFLTLSNANPDYFQLRYIDEVGDEIIRINRENFNTKPFIVKKENLQNKSNRYYFIETKELKKDEYWFSGIDLNIENNKIQKPLQATIRIVTPIYLNEIKKGVVIINLFSNEFLKRVQESTFFDLFLVSEDGNFIFHKNRKYNFTKDFEINYKISNEFVNYEKILTSDLYFEDDVFSKKLNLSQNREFYLVAKIKKDRLNEEMIRVAIILLIISILVLILSIPLTYYISLKFEELNKDLQDYIKIVDKYVIISKTSKDMVINYVSEAFCKVSKYSKDELIGKKHSILRAPDISDEFYYNLIKTITTGNSWHGEIKNIDKDKKVFWVEANIEPRFDKNGNIIGYTGINQNITNKKKIEELSIKDELTQLYNRRHFNNVFDMEINRARRDGKFFGFMIFDIDFFKQYNDTYGHQAGDEALIRVGLILNFIVSRASDFAFRLGGEEFGVIFTSLNREESLKFATYIKNKIEELKIEHKKSKVSKYMTVSIGLCITKEYKNLYLSKKEIYGYADSALYEAKKKRNSIVISNEC